MVFVPAREVGHLLGVFPEDMVMLFHVFEVLRVHVHLVIIGYLDVIDVLEPFLRGCLGCRSRFLRGQVEEGLVSSLLSGDLLFEGVLFQVVQVVQDAFVSAVGEGCLGVAEELLDRGRHRDAVEPARLHTHLTLLLLGWLRPH